MFRSTLYGVEMTKQQVKELLAGVFEAYTHRGIGGSGSLAREDRPPRKCLLLKQQAKICTTFGHSSLHGLSTVAHDSTGMNPFAHRSRLWVVKKRPPCDHLQTGEPS
jgi:hypothetical protein